AAVLEIDEQGVLARLALAQAAGVAAYVGGTVSTYRFRNALWRKALNDALSVERRIALHDRIGETLERLHTADPDAVVAALAKHFLAAASGGDHQRAVAYARRAGERAMTLLAYEEAIGHFARALDAIALPEPPGDLTPS